MAKRILTKERRAYLRWRISEHRRKLKLKAVEYKGGACSKCGYNKSIRSLVFHHINPEEKDFTISDSNIKTWDKIKVELDKCELLCSNCHGEVHDALDKINNEKTYMELRKIVPEKKFTVGSVLKQCFNCGKNIKVYKSAESKRNICSRKCSDELIYKGVWSDDHTMIEIIKTMSVKDIALKFGRSLSTTYAFIRSIKKMYEI